MLEEHQSDSYAFCLEVGYERCIYVYVGNIKSRAQNTDLNPTSNVYIVLRSRNIIVELIVCLYL